MSESYHHGNLRAHVLASAADVVAAQGPDALSMRELAREAGVTHGAPAHHFGSRKGLFTALAVEGFRGLAEVLEPTVERGDFTETAAAYVQFALDHPGHYALMFRADLVGDESSLTDAQDRAFDALVRGLATVQPMSVHIGDDHARRVSWGLVHGIASLSLAGAFPPDVDPAALAREGARQMFF